MPPLVLAGLVGIVIFCVAVFVLRSRFSGQETRTSVPGINRRKEIRFPVSSEFDLFWQDVDATHKSARARGIEVSDHGASVRCPKPIQRNSVIKVRGRHVQFEGKAVVRRCERKGLSYIIGLELENSISGVIRMRA